VNPYYADDWLTVHLGDCREVMATMEPESVHCVVTSPPYWGLRDYGTATWDGGDAACPHAPSKEWIDHNFNANSTIGNASTQSAAAIGRWYRGDGSCPCGATRIDSQLGLESTPEAYVESMVAVFREVWRVLRSDGTVWLNLGDSYAQSANSGGTAPIQGSAKRMGAMNDHSRAIPTGLKPKDLVGIPWRVAFALQADGWYLRSDIIWAKPNPMPESVTDRPTKSHEYLFLLAKSARYYFDADAVREPHIREWDQSNGGNLSPGRDYAAEQGDPISGGAGKRTAYPLPNPVGRNIRSVWTIATQPYPGAHFATFPRALVEPCIKAGCPPAGKRCDCDEPILTPLGSGPTDDPTMLSGRAGMNRPRHPDEGTRAITRGDQREYARQLRESPQRAEMATEAGEAFAHYIRTDRSGARPIPPSLLASWMYRGWLTQPVPCAHPVEPPGVVLDPFAGSGTTGVVAQSLSRRAVLIDLNGEYLEQVMDRNRDIPLGLGA